MYNNSRSLSKFFLRGLNFTEGFGNHWLSRYPRPTKVIHDHGPEFKGHYFQFSLDYAGIKAVNISPNSPTANSIIETTHKLIGQVIRTLMNLKPPKDKACCRSFYIYISYIPTYIHSIHTTWRSIKLLVSIKRFLLNI